MAKDQHDFKPDEKIGDRLRIERKNVGLNQTDLAAIGGVSLNTQHRYEAGGLPSTEYLLRIGQAGADWYWIVTGQRIGDALSQQETAFLDAFRKLDDVGRTAILLVAQRMANNIHASEAAVE